MITKFINLAMAVTLFSALFLTGCQTTKNRFKVATKTATIEQAGEIHSPAKVESSSGNVTIPLPKGSVISVSDSPEIVTVTLSEASKADISVARESVVSPSSFPPPSPSQIARGQSIQWFFLAGIGLSLAALASLYFGHGKAALIFGAGAVAVPLLGNFLASDIAQKTAIGIAVCGATLVAAWFLVKKKFNLSA
jgi:hypothetical protein